MPYSERALVYLVKSVPSSSVPPCFKLDNLAKIVLNPLPTVDSDWRVCATIVANAVAA